MENKTHIGCFISTQYYYVCLYIYAHMQAHSVIKENAKNSTKARRNIKMLKACLIE